MMLKIAYDWKKKNCINDIDDWITNSDLDASMSKGFLKANIHRIFGPFLNHDVIQKIWKMSKKETWYTHNEKYISPGDNMLIYNIYVNIEFTGNDGYHKKKEAWFRTFDLRDAILCHEILSRTQPYDIHSYGGICEVIPELRIFKCCQKDGAHDDHNVDWRYTKDKQHILPYHIDDLIRGINCMLLNDMMDNYNP